MFCWNRPNIGSTSTTSLSRWLSTGTTASTSNGSTNDGRTNDGRTNDGRTNDGRTNDGRTNDGRTNDGSTNDGSTNDGSTNDGSTRISNANNAAKAQCDLGIHSIIDRRNSHNNSRCRC